MALYNSGGLRADLAAGAVTVGDIYEIFPFGNPAVTFTLTGGEILGLMLGNAAASMESNRGAMQISGVQFTWRERMGVPEVVDLRIGGQSVDVDARYRVVSNSYVVDQADRYLRSAVPAEVDSLGRTIFEIAVEAAEGGPIRAPTRGRMAQVLDD